MLVSSFWSKAQVDRKVKVDPGVSVHNYKHPQKAKLAQDSESIQRPNQYRSRVGIVPRAVVAPGERFQVSTPKYKRRPGWSVLKKSNPTPMGLNPLTNHGNYKTQH